MATRLGDLYEGDFHAWTRDQARALRRVAETRPNEPVDWAHVIEEIEGLGEEQRNALRSWTARIIEHLLLLDHASAPEPRRHWRHEIVTVRREIDRRLTPTLKRDLVARLPRLYQEARADVITKLADEEEVGIAARLPVGCPYTLAEVLGGASGGIRS